MPKTKISEFSSTPASNTDIDSIFIGEGMAPSNVNDAIRELMAQLKDFQTGAVGDSFNGPVGTTTAAAGAFTTLAASSTLGVTGVSTLTGGAVVQGLTVGRGAGAVATNTAVGYQSLYSNTTGTSSTAVGHSALKANTATGNTAVGYEALTTNTSGVGNNAFGTTALKLNTTGLGNNAFGGDVSGVSGGALQNNTTGNYNTAMGGSALVTNTTGASNVAVGYQAGYSTTTGGTSTYIGYQAGYTNTTNDYNTYVGWQAGYTATGRNNTFVGLESGKLMTTGIKNTILGGYNGNQGSLDIRTASNYIVLSDGDGNPRGIFDGSGNLLVNTTTSTHSSVSSKCILKSTDNVLGVVTDSGSTQAVRFTNGTTAVGSINLTTSTTAYSTSSDYRLKNTIAPMTGALAKVALLNPCTYKWNADGSDGEGFIAHELAEVVPQCVSGEKDAVNAEGKPQYQGIDTSFLVAMLTAAIQEQQAMIEDLKTRLAIAGIA